MRLQYGRPASRAAAAAQPDIGGAAPSERELGVPTSTPTATVLAELGEPPLYVPWLAHAVCVWNSLVTAPAGVEPADLPWAAQLATAKQLVGIEFDVQQQQQVSPDSVRQAAMQRHLSRVAQRCRSTPSCSTTLVWCGQRPAPWSATASSLCDSSALAALPPRHNGADDLQTLRRRGDGPPRRPGPRPTPVPTLRGCGSASQHQRYTPHCV